MNELEEIVDAAEMNMPMNLIINLAVGSYFLGNPNENTDFPFYRYVDYIKVGRKNIFLIKN